MWYELGLEIGVPSNFLEQLKGYPDNECLIEVADYWLRNHPDNPTWSEIESIVYEFLPMAVNVTNKAKSDVSGNNYITIENFKSVYLFSCNLN